MIEIVLLALIPVATWMGWALAKGTTTRGERKRNRNFSHRYFQGLNYLLDEQPDKAIAVFIEMAEVTDDTIEPTWHWVICSDVAGKLNVRSGFTRISYPSQVLMSARKPVHYLSWARITCMPVCLTELKIYLRN